MSDRLWLASRSPTRAALLAAAGIAFEVAPSDVDEGAVKRAHRSVAPREIAGILAAEKALEVSRRHGGIVLGADQTLELEGALFDKPGCAATVRTQLLALRGRAHALHSALVLARNGGVVWRHVATARLTMRAFSDAFLRDYVGREGDAASGCVGGYRLEGLGAQLFERIEGDYFAVLGLPLLPLLDGLRRCGLAPS